MLWDKKDSTNYLWIKMYNCGQVLRSSMSDLIIQFRCKYTRITFKCLRHHTKACFELGCDFQVLLWSFAFSISNTSFRIPFLNVTSLLSVDEETWIFYRTKKTILRWKFDIVTNEKYSCKFTNKANNSYVLLVSLFIDYRFFTTSIQLYTHSLIPSLPHPLL